jgi:hypothetical protein
MTRAVVRWGTACITDRAAGKAVQPHAACVEVCSAVESTSLAERRCRLGCTLTLLKGSQQGVSACKVLAVQAASLGTAHHADAMLALVCTCAYTNSAAAGPARIVLPIHNQ